ncbi:MAG: hypothetical protein WD534_08025 [Phycisphaeraceae bacterium]
MMNGLTSGRWLALICVLALAATDALAQPRRSASPREAQQAVAPHAEAVRERVGVILDALEETGDFRAARQAVDRLFDQVLAYAPATDADAFREAGFARRLVTQLDEADTIDRRAVLGYLRANPRLAHAITFAIKPDNQVPQVYQVLDTLRERRGEHLETYAELAAAISVVHDRDLTVRINENTVYPPEPLELFDYYAGHERQMFFGIRNVPVELLIYIVDIGASVEEMQWALREHAGHRQVGRLFFTIEYDHEHFRRGVPKRVTEEGFNLPNIRAFGGVCADQAHYAVTVGKAIGVPAVYTRGNSSQVSHAWVGFLQQQGQAGRWDFNHGRYAAYQGVRGVTRDPQTRQWVDDSYVSLLAELIGTNEARRYAAVAMTDAVIRLHAIARAEGRHDLPDPLVMPEADGDDDAPAAPTPRSADMPSQLALLEAGLRQSHGHLPGWLMLAYLAESGEMTLAQKREWAEVVMRLCGQDYPDFAVVVLRPMVRTIEDLDDQNAVWERMFQMFRRRHDLAAEIRMEQGQMWETAGDFVKAGRCYEDVIQRYANAGPFVLDAVERTEAMLHEAGLEDRVLRLYDETWAMIDRPRDIYLEFQRQSNWYRLGMMYVEKLQQAGEVRETDRVLATIQQQVGS